MNIHYEKQLVNSSGIPFEYNNDNKLYSINYHGVRFSMPLRLAQSLHDWHVADPRSSRGLYPLVIDWYQRLDDLDRGKVKRIDIQTNSEI